MARRIPEMPEPQPLATSAISPGAVRAASQRFVDWSQQAVLQLPTR